MNSPATDPLEAPPETSKPSFLLTGTYSSSNKGDAAMQLATAQMLLATWPDAEVMLGAPFAEVDRAFYPQSIAVVPSTRRRLIWGSMQVVRAWLFRRLDQLGARLGFLVGNEELRSFERADVVVDLSGDMLTEDYGPHVTYSHFLPLLTALALGKPFVACAQSIGPFKWTQPLARFVLNRARAITARDEITLGLLRDAGVRGGHVRQTADMAFLLEPVDAARVDSMIEAEELEWPVQPVLGVSVSGLIAQHYDAGVGGDFAAALAPVLDRAVEELGAAVVFVSHVTGPRQSKDDRRMAAAVRDRMRHGESASVLRGDYRPDELKGLISRCCVFMGARMHANIAALGSGVPVVALEYSHKTPGILRLFGQEDASCPVRAFDAQQVWATLEDRWRRRDEISGVLSEKLTDVRRRSSANVDAIREALDQPGRRP
ncbi:MAG: polysaccharide pyruvyl transferase family protein [Acidobacteriota bacterium]